MIGGQAEAHCYIKVDRSSWKEEDAGDVMSRYKVL